MTALRGSRVLVTGGAGFIGSHLTESLVEMGARVTVVDDLSTGRAERLEPLLGEIQLVRADLAEALRSRAVAPDAFDAIFHLAANAYIPPSVERPAFDYAVNLQMTFQLLEALRPMGASAPRLLYVSSAGVYGNPLRLPIREDDPTVPISPYGVGKLAAERYVSVYAKLYGIRANSVRLFSVYGPRQTKQVVFDLFRKVRTDPHRIEILGDGTQERDFVFVRDAAQAMILMATRAPGEGEAFNVASGTSISIRTLVEAVVAVCGASPEVAYTGSIRPGDAEKWSVDIGRLQGIGYVPQTSLHRGLESIRRWYDDSPERPPRY